MTTAESKPVHEPSTGFNEGGERGITEIREERELEEQEERIKEG